MKKFITYLRSAMLIIVAMGLLISCGNDFNDMMKERTSPPSGGETPLPTPTPIPPPLPPITLSSISVKTQPTRTAYGLNSSDAVDLTGMELTLKYSDGSTQDKIYSPAEASLYSVANFDRVATGSGKTADVTYDGVTTTGGGNITGLGVHNFVANRTSGTTGYYGYDTLQTAFGSGGEAGQTAVITMYADEQLSGQIAINSTTNITLIGNGSQTIKGYMGGGAVFRINSGGALTLNDGITITGHVNTVSNPTSGGAVHVAGGTFTMNGGIIEGNKATWGGGVYIQSATFIMGGGKIRDNNATSGGGGVALNHGTFTALTPINDDNKATYIYGNRANQVEILGGTIGGTISYMGW
ncbi:hypothetical protein AGMMS50229_17440 [Campylobacterota bacterium]|nr:hypothetical protein AGMMS50229_17440 [Campylobacterota bacterium]